MQDLAQQSPLGTVFFQFLTKASFNVTCATRYKYKCVFFGRVTGSTAMFANAIALWPIAGGGGGGGDGIQGSANGSFLYILDDR